MPDWTETWLRAVCPAPAPCYLLRLERDYVGLNADDPAGAFLEVGGLIPAGLRAAVPRWVPVYFGACTII
ncbi:MAG: hypothetical protein LBR80_01705 [Deltaproteobacteria bacterium]|nr:hypothetical protein [Deltaproteobacteria bacterium]